MSFKVFNNRLPRTFQFACLAAAMLAGGVAQAASLTLYSAQHEQTVNQLVKDFEKQTGISVKVRTGEGPELAAQLLAEGSASPADVYFTENSPELMLLEEKGLLAPVQPATLSTIPARYNSPSGEWVGVLARENVLAYNTKLVQPAELPASLLDLAEPAWKGKVAIAPADADFLPLVSAMLAIKGEATTLQWLKGLRTNSQIFNDDEGVTAAVNRGGVAVGVINSYYWARLHTEVGDKGTHSALYHFAHADVGALINVSGVAVLKTARNQEAANKFVAYLTSESAQQLMASNKVTYEYPLRAGVAPDPLLMPFNQLTPPTLDMKTLGDDSHAVKLLRQAGLL
ncbi:iron ABC transporter substrate-binding protein [Pseudomonas gingeri]|uniref:Iron ABC transporter substrate-binding protein n=1 Tax=Pseudomonas gingeri TaxID=117681 RepID=A0A7Y8C1I1_9PSED|nr:iron ABC transporter substrate-binding protein [Pseudomonas gingeri]NWA24881.1 iron ABC transporter substrate-binding protein [Pseudomonas gingeri]NWB96510.1 iron ABC transporter substrate-binding protein [Pseudomonas gingeri]NWD71711.1 iron ABC transporter substrate-binding protein [Pseudomonas gingeri]